MPLRIDTTELYAKYTFQVTNMKDLRAAEWARVQKHKVQQIEKIKRMARLKRGAIKLLKGTAANKKILYGLVSKTLKSDIALANHAYFKARTVIHEKYQWRVWADWLRAEAGKGNTEALDALRGRESKQALTGNTVSGKGKGHSGPIEGLTPDTITKMGTIIYHVGHSAIRDDGDNLKVSRGANEEGLKTALQLAMKRYGSCIMVNGSDTFKEQIVRVAASSQLPITFEDAQLEKQRQDLMKNITTEDKNNELNQRRASNRRGTNRGRDEILGGVRARKPTIRRGVGGGDKPSISRIGQRPPPQSQNRLRKLSELSMVQLASGSEVLLPGHVSRHVEHQGTQSDNGVRRDFSGARITNAALHAAEKYIAERELKRQLGMNILEHRLDNLSDFGLLEFAGLRQIDGEHLVLLQRQEKIVVIPIDANTALYLKKSALGDIVKLSEKGIVMRKGRGL
jgi:hypothetical protein